MLKGPPTPKHLSRMYYELSQEGAHCSGAKYPWPYRPRSLEEKLVLAAELSRYDPRLLGILVAFIVNHWHRIRPQELRQFYPIMSFPQTLAVIAEFAKSATSDREMNYFMEYLQRGIKPTPIQFYFLDLYTPGGRRGQLAAEQSLAQYKKWGFLAREAPTVDVFKKKTLGRLDPASRKNVLQSLFQKKKEIQLADYLKAIDHSISRQQAFKDLKSWARLKKGSKGRGSRWVWKKTT